MNIESIVKLMALSKILSIKDMLKPKKYFTQKN